MNKKLINSIVIILLFLSISIYLLNKKNNEEENTQIQNISCGDLQTQKEMTVCFWEEAKDTHSLLLQAIQQEGDKEHRDDNSKSLDAISNTLEKEKNMYENDAITKCKIENKDYEGASVYSMFVSICTNNYYKKDLEEVLYKNSIKDFKVIFPEFPLYNKTTIYKLTDGKKDHILTVSRISKGGIDFKDEIIQAGKVVGSFSAYGRLNDYFSNGLGSMGIPNVDYEVFINEFYFDLGNGCFGEVAVENDNGKYAALDTNGCGSDIYKKFNGLYEFVSINKNNEGLGLIPN